MIKDEINWLADPKAELRRHPNDTLIMMLQKSGIVYLGYLSDNKPDDYVWKFRRYPDHRFTTIESMTKRGAKFALL